MYLCYKKQLENLRDWRIQNTDSFIFLTEVFLFFWSCSSEVLSFFRGIRGIEGYCDTFLQQRTQKRPIQIEVSEVN